MSDPKRYESRGVSASKSEVHSAISGLDKGLYPSAFCKILPDHVGADDNYVNIMHADTAGTKTSLAYIYWRATSDLSVWEGIAQDAIVMNLDDMACVGVLDNILLSSTIGRNKNIISGEVIARLIETTHKFAQRMKEFGINIHLAGGETADVGDIVRTIDVGYTAFARLKKKDLIVNDIQAGDVIVGLASYGQSSYETEYNAGMGSNGLTSARHDILVSNYRDEYPDSYDSNTPIDLIYSGTKSLLDTMEIDGRLYHIGKLILSPTRTYLPVLKEIISGHRSAINGIIHNTGGAHTKVKKFVKNKKIIKNNLLKVPPLFDLIRNESGTDLKEMFQVFNMGTRLEIYTSEPAASKMIEIARSFGIDAAVIGYVEEGRGESSVRIEYGGEVFKY